MAHVVKEIMAGFRQMPQTMVQLAIVQFFTWIALFSMWIYTTSAVADKVFGTTDSHSGIFQDAGNWVGTMFAVYNGVSALAAFLLPVFARLTSKNGASDLSCARWSGLDEHVPDHPKRMAAAAYDRCRCRMGQYSDYAVFDTCVCIAGRKDGLLHGRV
jgi:hypothetical protein